MRETIYEVLQQSGSLETKDIIIRLLMSVLIGIFIMLSYKISHSKTLYSKKFNVSLFMLTILTTTIFSYDEFIKFSNNKGFLLQSI